MLINRIRNVIAAVLGALALMLAAAPMAYAGLVSSVNYDQAVYAYVEDSDVYTSQTLSGSTFPVSTSITTTTLDGCSITADYNFTNSNAATVFDISCSASLNRAGQVAQEVPQDVDSIAFVLTQQASYTASCSSTSSQGTNVFINMIFGTAPFGDSVFDLSSYGSTPLEQSGTISAGSYIFNEGWVFGNTPPSQSHRPSAFSPSSAPAFSPAASESRCQARRFQHRVGCSNPRRYRCLSEYAAGRWCGIFPKQHLRRGCLGG